MQSHHESKNEIVNAILKNDINLFNLAIQKRNNLLKANEKVGENLDIDYLERYIGVKLWTEEEVEKKKHSYDPTSDFGYLEQGGMKYYRESEFTEPPLVYVTRNSCDTYFMNELLRAGANPNAQSKNGRTALFYASTPLAVKTLVNAGAMINMTDDVPNKPYSFCIDRKETPLLFACSTGRRRLDVIKELINCGANVYARDCDSETNLMLLARSYVTFVHFGSENVDETARFLIEYAKNDKEHPNEGQNFLDAVNKDGQSALMLAAKFTKSSRPNIGDFIDMLLKAGANFKLKDKDGKTAYDLVHMSDSLNENSRECKKIIDNAIKYQSKNEIVNAVLQGSDHLFNLAIQKREKLLKENGEVGENLDIDYVEHYVGSDLWTEEYQSRKNIYFDNRYMKCDSEFIEPILVHVTRNELLSSYIKPLLDAGANPNAQSREGRTALFYAAGSEAVKNLVEAKANVNIQDNNGETPLLFGCRNASSIYVIEELLKYGANIYITDKNMNTSLMHSLSSKMNENDFSGLRLSWGRNEVENIKLANILIGLAKINKDDPNQGQNFLNAVNVDGNNALMLAAYLGKEKLVSTLLKSSPNLKLKNTLGMTVLDIAKKFCSKECVNLIKNEIPKKEGFIHKLFHHSHKKEALSNDNKLSKTFK